MPQELGGPIEQPLERAEAFLPAVRVMVAGAGASVPALFNAIAVGNEPDNGQ